MEAGEHAPDEFSSKGDDENRSPGAPFVVGLALGVMFGIIFDNLAVGIALGMTGGILFTALRNNRAREMSGTEDQGESDSPGSE